MKKSSDTPLMKPAKATYMANEDNEIVLTISSATVGEMPTLHELCSTLAGVMKTVCEQMGLNEEETEEVITSAFESNFKFKKLRNN